MIFTKITALFVKQTAARDSLHGSLRVTLRDSVSLSHPVSSSVPSTALTPKMWLLLAGLFVASVVCTYAARATVLASSTGDVAVGNAAGRATAATANIPRLDSRLEADMAAALSPTLGFAAAETSDPFVDRAGFGAGGGRTAPTAVVAVGAPSAYPLGAAVPSDAPLNRVAATPRFGAELGAASSAAPATTVARETTQMESSPGFNQRLSARLARMREGGTLRPEAELYSYTDLQPVGVAGGNGQVDALLYATPTRRRIIAQKGTRFNDAELVAITADGVVFKTFTGLTRAVAWTRIAKSAGRESGATAGVVTPRTVSAPAPAAATLNDDFTILQQAVRERYSQTRPIEYPTKRPANLPLSRRRGSARVTGGVGAVAVTVPNSEDVVGKSADRQSDNRRRDPRNDGDLLRSEVPGVSRSGSVTNLLTDSEERAAARVSQNRPTTIIKGGPSSANRDGDDSNYDDSSYDNAMGSELDTGGQAEAPAGEVPAGSVTGTSPGHTVTAPDAATPTAETSTARTERAAPLTENKFCDASYAGEAISYDPLGEDTFGNLLDYIGEKFGINFLPDADVLALPVNIRITNLPWADVLRDAMSFHDLASDCTASGAIKIVKRAKFQQMADARRKAAPIRTQVIKLKYLQPTSGGRVGVTGRVQAGAQNVFESLEQSIQEILRAGGDTRGTARRVPGKNELFVSGTDEQLAEIGALIARADRPSYQVVVQALVYTANENRLRDIGVQPSAIIVGAGGRTVGGLTGLPHNTAVGGGTGGATPPSGGLNPGGVPNLGGGFNQPGAGLGASNPNAIFGLSTIIGQAQFAVQASFAESRGLINVQSRPFSIVGDGETIDLNVGRQIIIPIPSIVAGTAVQTQNSEVLEAGNVLQVTPQVAEDEQGRPAFVTLNLRIENNDVDTSVITLGTPSVIRRSLQTKFLLKDEQTVVIGGFAADSVSRARNQVPGLGGLPVIGNLFRRRIQTENRDRLYFAFSVKIIPQDASLVTVEAPSDATTAFPAPPPPQNPSPFPVKNKP